jgi:tyrosine-protein phosphatase YwqE
VWNPFKKKSNRSSVLPVKADMHSHLLPDLDDGVSTIEESVNLLKQFEALGYETVVTTPHILSDFYPNTPTGIRQKLEQVRAAAKQAGLKIRIEAAAEYYLDEVFYASLKAEGEEFLTFGNNYILFETGFVNRPAILLEAVFLMKSRGMQPVFAHPERYEYLQRDYKLAAELVERGAQLQININSLFGYYSPMAKKAAQKLIDDQLVSWIGTDCHNQKHFDYLKESIKEPYYEKLMALNLLNNQLL